MHRWLWKLYYIIHYRIPFKTLINTGLRKRHHDKVAKLIWVRVGDLHREHEVGGDDKDSRLIARIELAKSLKNPTSDEEIKRVFKSGSIRVVGSTLLDGHGRSYAILTAKGPDHVIQVKHTNAL